MTTNSSPGSKFDRISPLLGSSAIYQKAFNKKNLQFIECLTFMKNYFEFCLLLNPVDIMKIKRCFIFINMLMEAERFILNKLSDIKMLPRLLSSLQPDWNV